MLNSYSNTIVSCPSLWFGSKDAYIVIMSPKIFAFTVHLSVCLFALGLSSFHRSNCKANFDQTSQEWSVPILVVHITAILNCITLHKMATRAKTDKPCLAFKGQTSQECLMPILIVHAAGIFYFAAQNGHQS